MDPITLKQSKNLSPREWEVENVKRACIVALTSLGIRQDRKKAEESGFDGFLTKLISFVKIGELLDRSSVKKAVVL
jgi:hypothetical protein